MTAHMKRRICHSAEEVVINERMRPLDACPRVTEAVEDVRQKYGTKLPGAGGERKKVMLVEVPANTSDEIGLLNEELHQWEDSRIIGVDGEDGLVIIRVSANHRLESLPDVLLMDVIRGRTII